MTRDSEIESALSIVREEIAPYDCTLIVVTKTYPASDVEILRDLGCTQFGENRSSEGLEKSAAVPATWHFQGSIQSNKLRDISEWADVVHSLDSLRHAEKLSGILGEKSMDVFLQLSLDGDPQRGGVMEKELIILAESVRHIPQLSLQGLMCVPPISADPKEAFSKIASIHQRFLEQFPASPYLSAGMSNDYRMALDHGATHIRIGSKILGSRDYTH